MIEPQIGKDIKFHFQNLDYPLIEFICSNGDRVALNLVAIAEKLPPFNQSILQAWIKEHQKC